MIEHIFAAGEDVTSNSSDTMSDAHNSRHHLLRQKLTLDAGTPSDRAVTQSEVAKPKSKRRASSKHLSCKHMCNVTHLTRANRENPPCSNVCFDFCPADSESEAESVSALDDLGMSDELSQTDDETSEEKPQRFTHFTKKE